MSYVITLTGFNDADESPGPIELGSVTLPTSAGPEDAQRMLNDLTNAALPVIHEQLTPGAPNPVEPPDPGTAAATEAKPRRGAKQKVAAE